MPEKILVVDDEVDTLKLVGMMLESKGYQILAATNGPKAIAMAQSDQPDLVILDIMMPGIDGFEVTRRLRQNEATSHIPIIMFTAKTEMDDKVLGLELGADAYLTKPISTRELLAHVKAILNRTSRFHEPEQPGQRGNLIAITAPKGGLGVSTVALNLGIAIRKATSKKVVVADFRPGQGSIGLELGYTSPNGFEHLLVSPPAEINRRTVENELQKHNSGIHLLLSSPRPGDAKYLTAIANFEAIARQLALIADYVVVDLAPGITPLNDKIFPGCSQVFVIVEPVPSTVFQGKDYLQELRKFGLGPSQIEVVMVNRIRTSMQMTASQVQEQLGCKEMIVITPDPELAYQASTKNVPAIMLQPDSLASKQYTNLAARVVQPRG